MSETLANVCDVRGGRTTASRTKVRWARESEHRGQTDLCQDCGERLLEHWGKLARSFLPPSGAAASRHYRPLGEAQANRLPGLKRSGWWCRIVGSQRPPRRRPACATAGRRHFEGGAGGAKRLPLGRGNRVTCQGGGRARFHLGPAGGLAG